MNINFQKNKQKIAQSPCMNKGGLSSKNVKWKKIKCTLVQIVRYQNIKVPGSPQVEVLNF